MGHFAIPHLSSGLTPNITGNEFTVEGRGQRPGFWPDDLSQFQSGMFAKIVRSQPSPEEAD